jgi:hypothetical protein
MTAGPSCVHLRESVISRSRAGDELAAIERDLIAPAAASEDEKAALWLLAWSTPTDPFRDFRRSIVAPAPAGAPRP